MSDAPQPVFEEPWHAQLFALTVHLNETGHFAWPDWAARFSGTLMDHGLSGELDGGDDYFTAWLATLEEYLAQLKMPIHRQSSRCAPRGSMPICTPHMAIL